MKRTFTMMVVLLLAALACNVPGSEQPETAAPAAAQPQTAGSPQAPVTSGGEAQPQPTALPTPTQTPTPTAVPDQAVGLSTGLASLDTYVMTVFTRSQSGNTQEYQETTVETQEDHAQDSQLVHNISVAASPESSTPERSESFSYRIGLDSCTVSDGEAEFSTMDPLEKEISSIFNQIVDFLMVTSEPQFVGQETVNGVPANHFTFIINGLGSQSGADVTANQGEYWLAVDGQYLVKYSLAIELRSSPEVIHRQEFRLELTSINQPLTIAFPPECTAAKPASP